MSKHPKLPNGFGQIRYLGANRTNKYAVHPPAVIEDGKTVHSKAIAYAPTWLEAFGILVAYNNGTYTPEHQKTLASLAKIDSETALIEFIVSDYLLHRRIANCPENRIYTFSEVYEMWKKEKFTYSTLADHSKFSHENAYRHLKRIHNIPIRTLRHDDLQLALDDSLSMSYDSLSRIKSLIRQVFRFAEIRDLVDKDYSAHIEIRKAHEVNSGTRFTDEELRFLWSDRDNEDAELLLIMIYSGFRLGEYETLHVNLEDRYFQGGSKTAAGRNRIVPIHSAIYPFVLKRIEKYGKIMPFTHGRHGDRFRTYFRNNSMSGHRPHDTRHTFSALCESYGVAEYDRHRMLGHVIKDTTNGIYGHRTVEELRQELEKITVVNVL